MGDNPRRHAGLRRLRRLGNSDKIIVLLIDTKGNDMKYQFDIHHNPSTTELIGYATHRHTWREVAVLATLVGTMLLFII